MASPGSSPEIISAAVSSAAFFNPLDICFPTLLLLALTAVFPTVFAIGKRPRKTLENMEPRDELYKG